MSANLIMVKADSKPNGVAGAIAGEVRKNGKATLRAIGANCTNQAVKAIAIARGYMASAATDLICTIGFTTVTIDQEERTAMIFIVEPRHL